MKLLIGVNVCSWNPYTSYPNEIVRLMPQENELCIIGAYNQEIDYAIEHLVAQWIVDKDIVDLTFSPLISYKQMPQLEDNDITFFSLFLDNSAHIFFSTRSPINPGTSMDISIKGLLNNSDGGVKVNYDKMDVVKWDMGMFRRLSAFVEKAKNRKLERMMRKDDELE